MVRNSFNRIGWLFIGSILFAACTEVTLDSTLEQKPDAQGLVCFDITRGETRGMRLTNETLGQMGVFASKNLHDYDPAQATNEFMYNQLVQNQEGIWTYSPVKHWPSIEGVSFFAYAPYVNNPDLLAFRPMEEPGLPRFTYNVPQEIGAQIDLLVAEPKFDRYYYTTPSVDFDFVHTLSCIDFSAQVAADFPTDDVTMRVSEITITGLKSEGELPIRIDGEINWALTSDKTHPFLLSVANGALKDLLLDKNKQVLNSDTNKFMPLPQPIGEEVKLAIRAQYTSKAGTDEVVFESKLSDLHTALLPGKRYVINLILSVTGIVVDFEIVPWDECEMDIPSFN